MDLDLEGSVLTLKSGRKFNLSLAEIVAQPQPAPAPEPVPAPPPAPSPVPAPAPIISAIPMSPNDLRFAPNTPGIKTTVKNATYKNKTWYDNFGSGNQCFVFEGNGSDVLTLSQCYINGREGPRIGTGNTYRATLNIDQTYINCVGKGADHADGVQAYSGGSGQCLLNITNSYIRCYGDAEAKAKYGSDFIGSAAIFWADGMQGEVRITNSVIHGSGRGVCIYADKGTTTVSFKDVFFVGKWDAFAYDIRNTGGKIVIPVDGWQNVREATIVNGEIVPGALIPRPF